MEGIVQRSEFVSFRKKFKKTQIQMAHLLGISVRTVRSYEQGWRSIPSHVERQLLFLITRINGKTKTQKSCWTINKCPDERKNRCPAWEFKAGKFCWHINGTICSGISHKSWKDKIKICKKCKVLLALL